MDSVYEKYLHFYNKEVEQKDFLEVSFLNCFPLEKMSVDEDRKINKTEIDDTHFFYSNGISVGFYTEKNTICENYTSITQEYKKIQNMFGKITGFFGFRNKFLFNLSELFTCDADSYGLGDLETIFLEKSNGVRKVGEINLDKIYTFAYETNGNRFLINENNQIYLFTHDSGYNNLIPVNNCPRNTFFKIPNINNIFDFANIFIDDFLIDKIENNT